MKHLILITAIALISSNSLASDTSKQYELDASEHCEIVLKGQYDENADKCITRSPSSTPQDAEIKQLQARIKELRAEKKKSKLKIQIEKAMKKLAELKDKEDKI